MRAPHDVPSQDVAGRSRKKRLGGRTRVDAATAEALLDASAKLSEQAARMQRHFDLLSTADDLIQVCSSCVVVCVWFTCVCPLAPS